MPIPGIEIHRSYDDYGMIRVFEEAPLRYLSFGQDAQQSCINMLEPAKLCFSYTQAMMLALLYIEKPKAVTVLGLGAGSLVHTLHHYDPSIRINAIELRPEVANVSKQWFNLPVHPAIKMLIDDAEHFLESKPTNSDIIFADIYNDDGMIESQLEKNFISLCYQHLNPNGILVLNVWDEGKGSHPKARQVLTDYFSDNFLACPIEDGNLIIFAFKNGMPPHNTRRLQTQIKKLQKQLGFPMHRFMQKIHAL